MNKAANQTLFISLFLDTRREKANGLFPVKLRVFYKPTRKQMLYSTRFEMTEKDFQSTWLTIKPRQGHKEQRKEMQALLAHAENTADRLKKFSFEAFEKRLFVKVSEAQNLFYHYQNIISGFREKQGFGTADNYEMSMHSIQGFVKHKTGKECTSLLFSDVTAKWLEQYERYMTGKMNRSRTTVSMYLRALRTVFNVAISQNDIEADQYPFYLEKTNKSGYKIPTVSGVKKALHKTDLRRLFDAPTRTPEQKKARDFWFFSYSCNGINIKDIAQLRWKDVDGETIQFYRAKTINTSKDNLKATVIYLSPFAKAVIDKYGNENKLPNNLIFSIITDEMGEYKKHTSIKNFTRFINQHLKELAATAGITEDISTYWARHSFATNAIRGGAKMEQVSEALSHRNLKTTQTYFAGFVDSDKIKLTNEVMNF